MIRRKGPRACVFVHYDKDDLIDDYVVEYLRHLRPHMACLVFVSTARLATSETAKVADLCDQVVVRENIGYDFFSWKVGLSCLPPWDSFEELVLCNDSVYGPLGGLDRVFSAMEETEWDLWGITDSSEVDYHLQSYFLVFRKALFQSSTFRSFWDDLAVLEKTEIISHYEIGLTRLVRSSGYSVGAYFRETLAVRWSILLDYLADRRHRRTSLVQALAYLVYWTPGQAGLKLNKLLYFPSMLLKRHVPFVKIQLLRSNPMGVDLAPVWDHLENSGLAPRVGRHRERMQGGDA